MPEEKLARDIIKNKEDNWYDKVFVKYFVKKVQDLDPDVGAIVYPDTFQLVFVWKGVIIYKITLNKLNVEDISVDKHIEKLKSTLIMLRMGMVSATVMQNIKNAPVKLNTKRGKIL
jgi:hypothetical protein